MFLTLCCIASPAAFSKDQSLLPILRWDPAQPGCTFFRNQDRHYQYRVSTGDLSLTLTLDSQELQKVDWRVSHFLAFHFELRYTGSDSIDFDPLASTLEFQEHYHQVRWALDPDELSTRLQEDMDALNDETRRRLRKHPEQADKQEKLLQERLREIAEMQEFLGSQGLRPAILDSLAPQVSGWVLFSTDSKWIGRWKKQEHFLLRVPVENRIVVEFPIAVPPKDEKLTLRTRPAD